MEMKRSGLGIWSWRCLDWEYGNEYVWTGNMKMKRFGLGIWNEEV
jgi:hypothetical protein